MTEDSTPHQSSPDPSDGTESGAASERELDELLAQASSLAADLSEDVGTTEEPAEARPISRATPDLDAELSELERLVAETTGEVANSSEASGESAPVTDEAASTTGEPVSPAVQAATPSADGSENAPRDASPQSAEDKPVSDETNPVQDEPTLPETEPAAQDEPPPVPDFMAEFTHPDEPAGDVPAAAAAPPHDHSSADHSAPTISTKEDIGTGSVPGVADAPTRSLDGDAVTQPAPFDEPADVKPAGDEYARLTRLMQHAATRLSPLAQAACARAVTTLEHIDRPLSRLGRTARKMLGWVAIATAGMAVIVLLLTLF